MRDSGLPGIRLEKSAGNNGGAEKSRAQSRVERFPVNFFFSGAQVGYEKVRGSRA